MSVVEEARKALRCLYIAVDESVARDVEAKCLAALKQARREALEEARDTVCMACRYKAPMEGRTYHQPYEMSAVQEFCLAFAIRALLDASEAGEGK